MAKTDAVWGIDIGQCSLKALRCTPSEDGTLVATAFDYIEYPKILSQPDANPDELIREALEQFLSRNELKGDKVAISVSGQAGLSRFFKPPPVDAKTLPDIVKFEAHQVIPFALEDVIWDYQQIAGKVVDGVTLDAEVGLFAMKREAVFKALQPFLDAEIEVDVVQLSPLTVYNVVQNDILTNLPDPNDVDPKSPPESIIVIAMGTDTTDLVITDGFKLWLRNIPIGGNHFTKQLSRELKLTYAKAEHLKRNARKAEDPKTIFQAMRPVFSDLVTELQRSISYFQGIERSAHIGHIAMFGNASNLPGLRQYLTKHLGIEIKKFSEFKSLSGDAVVGTKSFQENFLSFSSCYGLCLQGQKKARLKTNLLPQEFVTERLIRAKKPWALATVGALLIAFTFHYFFTYQAWREVHPDTATESVSWQSAIDEVGSVQRVLGGFQTTDKQQMEMLNEVHAMESAVTGVTDGRRLWSEILSTVHQVLPPYPPEDWVPSEAALQEMLSPPPVDPNVTPYVDRPDIYVEHVETQYFPDLSVWYGEGVKARQQTDLNYLARISRPAAPADDAAAEDPANTGGTTVPAGGAMAAGGAEEGAVTPPSGPGWVIEIQGHHYFNGPENRRNGTGAGNYVRRTIIKKILDKDSRVLLPMPPGSEQRYMQFSMEELGLSHPVLTVDNLPDYNYKVVNEIAESNEDDGSDDSGEDESGNNSGGEFGPSGGNSSSSGGPDGDSVGTEVFDAPRYDFTLQIVWIPTSLNERLLLREERKAKQAAEAAASAGQFSGQQGPGPGNGNQNNALGGDPTNNTVPDNAQGIDDNSNNADGGNGDPQGANANAGNGDAGDQSGDAGNGNEAGADNGADTGDGTDNGNGADNGNGVGNGNDAGNGNGAGNGQ